MPTGYTAVIEDGCTFKEYVMTCARAFGATISMREEPLSKEIPEKFEVSDYALNQLKAYRTQLALFQGMPKDQLESEFLKERQKHYDEIRERSIKNNAINKKYEQIEYGLYRMLGEARALVGVTKNDGTPADSYQFRQQLKQIDEQLARYEAERAEFLAEAV